MSDSPRFELQFSNVPVVNLRREFLATHQLIFSDRGERAIKMPIEPIDAPLFVWRGMPEPCFTVLLQRSIAGVEAYLPAALIETAFIENRLSPDLIDKIREPFSFGSSTAVTNLYDLRPAAVRPDLSLKICSRVLYERTHCFYNQIRNPVSHGGQIANPTVTALREAFGHIAKLYEWIDSWYDLEHVWPGGRILGDFRTATVSQS